MRLQKFLASSGIASRRKSEDLIKEGIVKVNGKIITEMGYKIDPEKDQITVRDKKVNIKEAYVYVLLNKPTGYITTASDQFNRKKVIDLVNLPYRLFPVGRLDYNTSGLLLLTNDGELTFKLTHPKFKVEKTYIARVEGKPSQEEQRAFERGLRIEDYVTSPAKLKIIKEEHQNSILEIKIREGKNRQVRKMCAAIGHPVVSLKRIAVGKIKLGKLPSGEWRYLTTEELQYLKNI
ncbi:pseudouridine synthase [Clostridium formicaceticum]|uniref:Pseudouridine synthase n=1 Tax=Clostridium formicaceticum TaxID=1497 RepID=A0AAC9RP48_9CLOT|nr:pseudouridine synthase [Clostridium formicaceticum]AOY77251.1 pseudouridine synthase [Clostridium formicaceticum]ARE87785.1 Ribosomal large subunit pseudouridine synthase B [Clostridium formicaceticum]